MIYRCLYVGIIQPELIFPYAGIREQLATMFRRKGFENSLRHWANRLGFDDILTTTLRSLQKILRSRDKFADHFLKYKRKYIFFE